MRPELNEIYVYRPSDKLMEGMFSKLSHRHVKGQTTYYMINGLREESEDVHRYALSFEIEGEKRTLLILTKQTSKKEINKLLKMVAEDIASSPTLLGIFNGAGGKPVPTGIKYAY